jgi:beta-N-acetylhexosaminidase
MIMTAHIIYPNIENETYVSKKDGNSYKIPATLSKKILTDILRKDM